MQEISERRPEAPAWWRASGAAAEEARPIEHAAARKEESWPEEARSGAAAEIIAEPEGTPSELITVISSVDYPDLESPAPVEKATKGGGGKTSLREQRPAAPPQKTVLSSIEFPPPEESRTPVITAPVVEEATKGDGTTSLREQRRVATPKITTVLPSIEFPPPESGAPVAGEAAHEAPTSRGSGPEPILSRSDSSRARVETRDGQCAS